MAADLALMQAKYLQLESKYSSLKGHISQLAALGNAAFDMMKQDSLDNLLQYIATEIVNLTNANGAYMHMVHETGDYLLVVASHGKLEAQLMGNTRKRGIGLSAKAWDTGLYQYTDSYNQNYNEVVVFPEELKAVSIPLTFSGSISGVAFITSSTNNDLHSQIPILQEITKIASLAIFYTKQLETKQKELQRIKALSVLGNTLYQSTDWDAILNSASAQVFDIFDIEQVRVYQHSKTTDKLIMHDVHKRTTNGIESYRPSTEALSVHSISYWCFENNQFAQVNRNLDDPRESSLVHEHRSANNIGSTMCIPINYQEKPWGVLTILKSNDKCDFDESDANAFHAVASQLSTALQRNSLLSTVQHQAYHDSLTKLPNRLSFEDHFSTRVANGTDEYAMLFCDLDGFKNVNDTHGHNVGDKVLEICAARMSNCIRNDNYLARMGGDEFAILMKLTDDNLNIDLIAKRFVDALSEPIHAGDIRVHIGASIGVSLYPNDGTTFSELLNRADVAMYQAKHSGRGKILRFNKKDAEEIREKNEMRTDLVGALANNEFELWYQPQVCWENLKVTGVEALIRWNHPNKGTISPIKFIPIAEESGFIDPLGMWIMEEAIAHLSTGVLSNYSEMNMGVNIAPPQFLDDQFSSNILLLLEKHNVAPSRLKVEITESFIMHDTDKVVMHLKNLRNNGVMVAIDDFGTGYSSLSYLQDLPLDVLKIDRSFVNKLTKDNFDKSIASIIITLATSLGLTTIAEGVETEEQLDYIRQLGCELIQGYYYSKPVLATDLPAVIDRIENGNQVMLKKSA